MVLLKPFGGFPEVLIHAPQRRPSVARNKARRIESVALITYPLVHGQTYQRMHATEPRMACSKIVFVV